MFRIVAFASIFTVFSGCASSRLPLCPKIAVESYPSEQGASSINYFLAEAASNRAVKLSLLSPFIVELRGSSFDLNWIEKNYKYLICAFDPSKEQDIKAAYMTCMTHAPEWLAAIKSKQPQNLMLDEYLYRERCLR